MEEIWKPVVGYEDLYEVSNKGVVRSLGRETIMKNGVPRTFKPKVMKQTKNNSGYMYVTLYSNDSNRNYYVHRIVAEAFLPNPDELPQVNHIDGNKENNSISNLEWCTCSHNIKEAYRMGLHENHAPKMTPEILAKIAKTKELKGNKNPNRQRPVMQMDLDGNDIQAFESAGHACEALGYKDKSSIAACCTGRKGHKTYMGYTWRHITKEEYENSKNDN